MSVFLVQLSGQAVRAQAHGQQGQMQVVSAPSFEIE